MQWCNVHQRPVWLVDFICSDILVYMEVLNHLVNQANEDISPGYSIREALECCRQTDTQTHSNCQGNLVIHT